MKRIVIALLFLVSLPLYAVQITSVDDVIRMHQAGVDADLLLAIVQTPHEPFAVTEADVKAMEEAGVPGEVIDALIAQTTTQEVATASTASTSGDWCVTFEPPFPLDWPDYFYIPRWLWDPHWYYPRLDSTIASAAKKNAEPAPAAKERKAKSVDFSRFAKLAGLVTAIKR